MCKKFQNFPDSDTRLWLVELYTFFRIQVQDYVSLKIKKKRGSSIDLDIHHSKVPCSEGFLPLTYLANDILNSLITKARHELSSSAGNQKFKQKMLNKLRTVVSNSHPLWVTLYLKPNNRNVTWKYSDIPNKNYYPVWVTRSVRNSPTWREKQTVPNLTNLELH